MWPTLTLLLWGCSPGDAASTDSVAQDGDDDGYTEDEGDCDDIEPSVYPNALELSDGLDNDCDGLTDEPVSGDLDGGSLLVVPTSDGLTWLDSGLSPRASHAWVDLVPACDQDCFGEGTSTDGDGILASYVEDNQAYSGGVIRVAQDGQIDWSLRGLAFPHDVVRDPVEGTVIVAEAYAYVGWFAGDGSSDTPIRQLDPDTEGYVSGTPNGLDLITHDGRTTLLICSRDGVLTQWDITTPGAPVRLWRFPALGDLSAPHGAVVRELDGTFYLLYAHTWGGVETGDGSIGVASMADPSEPPLYLADLVVPALHPGFDFLRGVELTTSGDLLITDSGDQFVDQGPAQGRIWRAPLPALTATGATGVEDESQVFVELTELTELTSELPMPFEGRLSPIP